MRTFHDGFARFDKKNSRWKTQLAESEGETPVLKSAHKFGVIVISGAKAGKFKTEGVSKGCVYGCFSSVFRVEMLFIIVLFAQYGKTRSFDIAVSTSFVS